jgi:hypothetical protein
MRRTLVVAFLGGLLGYGAFGFDEEELIPTKAQTPHMWHIMHNGAHVCFFPYKFVSSEVEKALEEAFDSYVFCAFAIWNEEGKDRFRFDGVRQTFHLQGRDKGAYGVIDPPESFSRRLSDRISSLSEEQRKAEDWVFQCQFGSPGLIILDTHQTELIKWARARRLTNLQTAQRYRANVEAAVKSFRKMQAVVSSFSCVPNQKEWALVAIQREKKIGFLEGVTFVDGDTEVPMARVVLTNAMLKKLDLKERSSRSSYYYYP